jgi:hypothetical protein
LQSEEERILFCLRLDFSFHLLQVFTDVFVHRVRSLDLFQCGFNFCFFLLFFSMKILFAFFFLRFWIILTSYVTRKLWNARSLLFWLKETFLIYLS